MNCTNQRYKIAVFLKEKGSMTTLEARETLKIMHPGGRVQELRERGFQIVTEKIKPNGIAKYILLSPTPPLRVALHDQYKTAI